MEKIYLDEISKEEFEYHLIRQLTNYDIIVGISKTMKGLYTDEDIERCRKCIESWIEFYAKRFGEEKAIKFICCYNNIDWKEIISKQIHNAAPIGKHIDKIFNSYKEDQ